MYLGTFCWASLTSKEKLSANFFSAARILFMFSSPEALNVAAQGKIIKFLLFCSLHLSLASLKRDTIDCHCNSLMNQHPSYKDQLSSLSFKMRNFIMDLIGGEKEAGWRRRWFWKVARNTLMKNTEWGFGWLLMKFVEWFCCGGSRQLRE